jgi:hypothetical protein
MKCKKGGMVEGGRVRGRIREEGGTMKKKEGRMYRSNRNSKQKRKVTYSFCLVWSIRSQDRGPAETALLSATQSPSNNRRGEKGAQVIRYNMIKQKNQVKIV